MTGLIDCPADRYHADQLADQPTLSSGVARILLNSSPLHAWTNHPRLNPAYQPTADDKFDLGTVVHQILLEGLDAIEVIDADDWRSKDAKAARDAARAAGRIPLLTKHRANVAAMVDAFYEQIVRHEADPAPLTNGRPEQTIVWEEAGVLCRARIDWLHNDHAVCDDLKSTGRSAEPGAWIRSSLYGNGYDVQAAFYLRGVEAVTGIRPRWRWIVIEAYPPYGLSVIEPGPDMLALADDKVDHAIAIWRDCLRTGEWPGYTTKVATAGLLPWHETQWLERQDVAA